MINDKQLHLTIPDGYTMISTKTDEQIIADNLLESLPLYKKLDLQTACMENVFLHLYS